MSALPAAHFYHSADDDGAGVIHEDSPPGLTASGSSDDGSSPSSVGQRNIKMGGGSVVSSSSKAPSEAATAFDAMSPWSSHSSDAIVDTSSAHDWASPFNSATEHHFFDGVGSQSYDNHDAHMSYPSAGSSSSLQQHPFIPSSPGIAAPGNAEAKDELRQASQRMAGGSAERSMGNGGGFNPSTSPSRPHTASMWNSQSQQKPSSDEQMFDSIIEEDSFGPPSTRNSDYAGSPPPRGLASVFGAMHMPSNSASPPGLSSFGVLDGIKIEQQDEAMRPSTGVSSSQQQQASAPPGEAAPAVNGNETVETADDSMAPSAIAGPSSSPHGDTEVAFSASTVVRPEVDGLADLQIHVHGIAARGAKSRVETQIKAHLELVRPSKDDSAGSSAWERIGSFTHLKLPPLSATKRKTKKNQQGTAEIPKEKTLYLDVAVVNASPPHQRAFACQSCSEREKKRADRRKSGRTKSGPLPSEEEMRRLGVDPSSPDAGELAAERLTQEESKRIILFNCGDYLEFKDGHTELPTRVTCYCRHHKEKLGFCILFTMRNWKGKTVACGSTPAIMITDDHKSSAALERSKREAAQQSSSSGGAGAATPAPSSMADRSRANSTDTNVGGDAAGGASRNSKAKKSRPKPYDSSRRSTVSNGAGPSSVAMTPAASNGGGAMSPTTGSSPSMDLVTALAAIGNERALLLQQQHQQQQQQQQQHHQIATPPPQSAHSHSQPQFQMPMPQQPQHNGINGHHEQQQQQPQQHTLSSMGTMPFASMLSQGSISPETLLTNPLSLPGIDFNNPAVAQQMLAILGHQALVPGLNLGQPSSSSSPHQGSAPPSLPQARISKIIPGEGPTTGGIEVTILGDNFTDGLTCLFGDLAASSTRVWAANTLICVLPPSPSPGPVAVTLKTAEEMSAPGRANSAGNGANAGPLQLFTYVDKSDTQLMELALQVVGFQQTRTMQVPRDIALRLISSGQGSINSSVGQQQQQQQGQGQQQQQQYGSDAAGQLSHARNAVDGLFAAAGEAPTSFQDTMIHFCNVIAEGQHDAARPDAIRLANKNGHTLLHLATMLGFHRLASKLLSLGCPVDARDRNGMTALHLAALGGRVAVTRVLLEAGARREVASLTNKVAIDLAREQDAVDVEDLLVHCQMRGQQQHGLSHAEDSSLFDSDYDVDDDNVSTTAGSVGEEREVDWEDDDEDSGSESERVGDSDDAQDARPETTIAPPTSADVKPSATSQDGPRFLPSTTSTEEKSTKQSLLLPPPASASLNEKQQQQGLASPLTSNAALRALANKVPGGLAFLGVAGGLQDRLLPHSLQQRISVFHMQTQEQQTPFTDDSGQASGSGEVKAAAAGNESNPTSATSGTGEQDTWRLMSLWRNLVEETGGLWHGRAPPPAYEEAAPNGSGEAAATATDEKAPVVEDEQEQAEVASPPVTPSTTASQLSPTSTPTARRMSRRTSTSSLDSCSTSASSTLATGSPSRSAPTTPAATPAARRRIVVEDDWMLRWFWLPCLALAFLVAAFSTGPLSLAGLASYVPQLGAGGTTAASASAAAVAAADGAREAARAVVGNEGVAAAAAAANGL